MPFSIPQVRTTCNMSSKRTLPNQSNPVGTPINAPLGRVTRAYHARLKAANRPSLTCPVCMCGTSCIGIGRPTALQHPREPAPEGRGSWCAEREGLCAARSKAEAVHLGPNPSLLFACCFDCTSYLGQPGCSPNNIKHRGMMCFWICWP